MTARRLRVPPLTVLAACLLSGGARAETLNGITVDADMVTLQLSGQVAWSARRLSKERPRLVIDLANTVMGSAPKERPGKGSALRRVRAGQFKAGASPVARVVLDLNAHVEYAAAWDGSALKIKLNGNGLVDPPATEENGPLLLPYQGYLGDKEGKPLAGTFPVAFKIMEADTDKPVWKGFQYVTVEKGAYAVKLGEYTKLPENPLAGSRFVMAEKLDADPPPPAGPLYFVQVGAFADGSRALTLERRLRDQIVGSSWAETEAGGKKLFLVRLGPYAKKAQADAARGRLAALGYPGVIRKSR